MFTVRKLVKVILIVLFIVVLICFLNRIVNILVQKFGVPRLISFAMVYSIAFIAMLEFKNERSI